MRALLARFSASPAAGIAAALLFAFPLFATSVTHWASGVYYLLALIALASLRRPDPPLAGAERVFLGVIAFYLAATLIANTLSGWTYASVRWYEADFRILLSIPLFLLLRRYPEIATALIRAVPVAAVVIGIYVIHGTLANGGRFYGPYSPILIGNFAALLAVLSLISLRFDYWPQRIRIPLHVAGAALALIAAALSGTRSAWLAAAITLPIAVWLMSGAIVSKSLRRRLALGVLAVAGVVVTAAIVVEPDLTQKRLGQAVEQATRYITAETAEQRSAAAASPVGIRFEQWRVALLIFTDNPLFGIGVGNVSDEINRLISTGVASPAIEAIEADLGKGSHLHSAYFDALVFKGLTGLVALLCLLFCPIYLALRPEHRHSGMRDILIVQSLAFAIFSLTEDPFIRNNFISIFLVFTVSAVSLLFAEARGRSR